jgi:prepilin-type N-terminal cleavage/methylation domain-containing protein
MKRASTRHQRGFTLIEMSIAAGIWLAAFMAMAKVFVVYMSQEGAHAAGVKIAQYNAAVAAFINGSLPNVPLGNYQNTAWLKDAATCPGATGAIAYLPCSFEDFIGMDLAGYNTTITQPNPPFFRAVTNVGAVLTDGRPDGGLGGAVVRAAESWIGLNSLRLQAERQAGISRYDIDENTAIITATVDTATNADAWLRRDGTNAMAADLNAGGFDVTNARDANAGRNVTANTAGAGGDMQIANTNNGTGPMSLAGALQGGNIVGQGAAVVKPVCPPGSGLQPKILTWVVQMNDNGTASPIGSIQSYADDAGGQWFVRVKLNTALSPGGVFPNVPNSAKIAYAVACQP